MVCVVYKIYIIGHEQERLEDTGELSSSLKSWIPNVFAVQSSQSLLPQSQHPAYERVCIDTDGPDGETGGWMNE